MPIRSTGGDGRDRPRHVRVAGLSAIASNKADFATAVLGDAMGKRSGNVNGRAGCATSAAGLNRAAGRREVARQAAVSGTRRGTLALLLACGLGVASPVYAQTAIFQETFTGGTVTSSGTPVTPAGNPASITNFTGAAPTNM
ncbi:MAG: hypothetical protein JF591_04865, partial [Lysobacter sp.]|nr:hypothetical protein [Lysobacter sp.]